MALRFINITARNGVTNNNKKDIIEYREQQEVIDVWNVI